ncbi:lectin beta-1 and beta-2 chains-like, partial [Prunus avium]|uniref:Lectin beta-1 and beta-2 chains-like n=1 Tax=Prunus avium TaxID=42229 RepID=A0A6P5U3N3_PRUAV
MVVLLLLLLFHLAPCATSLNFSFPTFPNSIINTLSLEGNASVDGKFLRLTNSAVDDQKNQSAGQATYSQPFLLRDNATGKLADFTTTFTFTINSQNKTPYADGLAFFLAPNESALNTTIGRGGALGLPIIHTEKNELTNQYPFVAVEFDIFQNTETYIQDPAGDHVGIDVNSVKSNDTSPWNGGIMEGHVNSVKSNATSPWNGGIMEGRDNNASIRYDSGSKNLSVTYTTYENGVSVEKYLDYK